MVNTFGQTAKVGRKQRSLEFGIHIPYENKDRGADNVKITDYHK